MFTNGSAGSEQRTSTSFKKQLVATIETPEMAFVLHLGLQSGIGLRQAPWKQKFAVGPSIR